MKTAVVICTLNAATACNWEETLRQLSLQSFRADLYLIADSESGDRTVEMAREYGWQVQTVRRRNFNHGETRNGILSDLQRAGFDAVVFLSQDVVPANRESVRLLVEYLTGHDAAVAYGRQIPLRKDGADAWQRMNCYPEHSEVRSAADIPARRLMTAFCSNAFSVWNIRKALANGGFPHTCFGEDMLLAATCILAGERIGYCAEAVCRHGHSGQALELFKRGIAVGRFHADYPWLLDKFGGIERPVMRKVNPATLKILPALAVKYLGYRAGRLYRYWFVAGVFLLIWLLLLPMVILDDIPRSDVAERYAPMAEYFSRGDWGFAFHPRVAPLFPAIAGVLCFLFGAGGFMGCKLAGALMLSICVFPLWGMLKSLYGDIVAKVGVILFAVCSHLLRMGYSGLRESTTCFGLLLCAYMLVLIFDSRRSFRYYLLLGLALGILLLSRSDTLLIGGVIGLVVLVLDLAANKIPVRSVAVAAAVLLLISPFLAYNYHQVGYLALDVRYAAFMRAVERKYDINLFHNPSAAIPLDIDAVSLEGGKSE